MIDAIQAITGFDATNNYPAAFASRYTAGDFNGTHNDINHFSAVAFVLNMTKYWLPCWGGNLVILDEDFDNIIEAYTPKFNTMIIFDVPIPHAVLPVSIYSQSERLAVSGWYLNLKKEPKQ